MQPQVRGWVLLHHSSAFVCTGGRKPYGLQDFEQQFGMCAGWRFAQCSMLAARCPPCLPGVYSASNNVCWSVPGGRRRGSFMAAGSRQTLSGPSKAAPAQLAGEPCWHSFPWPPFSCTTPRNKCRAVHRRGGSCSGTSCQDAAATPSSFGGCLVVAYSCCNACPAVRLALRQGVQPQGPYVKSHTHSPVSASSSRPIPQKAHPQPSS